MAKYTFGAISPKLIQGAGTYDVIASWPTYTGSKDLTYRNSRGTKKVKKGVSRKSMVASWAVVWQYRMMGLWFEGSSSTVAASGPLTSTYTAPDGSTGVRCYVKAASKTYVTYVDKNAGKKGKNPSWVKETPYYFSTSAKWAGFDFAAQKPDTPEAPTIALTNGTSVTVKCSSDAAALASYSVQLQVDGSNESAVTVKTDAAQLEKVMAAGYGKSVRARFFVTTTKGSDSSWSPWSDYAYTDCAAPNAPNAAAYDGGAVVSIEAVSGAKSYKVAYSMDKAHLETDTGTVTTKDSPTTTCYIDVMESGGWYFKARAVSINGSDGAWSDVAGPFQIGAQPTAPTTFNGSDGVVIGEPAVLAWVHNCADGGQQAEAEVETENDIGGGTFVVKGAISQCNYETADRKDGEEVRWRVRTKSASGLWSPWSGMTSFRCWERPTASISVKGGGSQATQETPLSSMPLEITVTGGTSAQRPVCASAWVTNVDEVEVVGAGGTTVMPPGSTVWVGELGFDGGTSSTASVGIGEISLVDGHEYVAHAVVVFDSGLAASASCAFAVSFGEFECDPQCSIECDADALTASVTVWADVPNADEGTSAEEAAEEDWEPQAASLAQGVTLSVLRIESDGSTTPLASGIANDGMGIVTDPHPRLDRQAYRVVATSTQTGQQAWADGEANQFGTVGAVVQWDESWSESRDGEDATAYAGRRIVLPYNVSVSESGQYDAALVSYWGREAPVAYFGDQRNTACTIGASVKKSDTESIDALRALQSWRGECHVRTSNGVGWWAQAYVDLSTSYDSDEVKASISCTMTDHAEVAL